METQTRIQSPGTTIVLLLVLVGCTPSESVYTAFTAKAWIDSNENGGWDDHEQPLAERALCKR